MYRLSGSIAAAQDRSRRPDVRLPVGAVCGAPAIQDGLQPRIRTEMRQYALCARFHRLSGQLAARGTALPAGASRCRPPEAAQRRSAELRLASDDSPGAARQRPARGLVAEVPQNMCRRHGSHPIARGHSYAISGGAALSVRCLAAPCHVSSPMRAARAIADKVRAGRRPRHRPPLQCGHGSSCGSRRIARGAQGRDHIKSSRITPSFGCDEQTIPHSMRLRATARGAGT
jgi:hypothetical protein